MEERYCLPDWFFRHRRLSAGTWAPWGISEGGRATGGVHNFNGFKDHLGFIYRMNLSKCVEIHDGCVNTIMWNDQGRLILSGSDDLLLKITDPFQGKVLTSIGSGHRANIFKAKFFPFSDDEKIISCSGDGQLIYTEVLRPETHGTFRFTCHQGSTATVETINNDPFSFMSCGEDGTVRHFDIRTRTSCRKRHCNHDVIYKSCCAVSALAVNQLVPYQMAVCCTDGVVRLLDRRYMYGGVRTEPGTGSRSNRRLKGSFLRFSPLKPSHECEEDEEKTVRRRITSVQFCPSRGDEVLVSYSGDSIYLFGLDGKHRGDGRGSRKIMKPQPTYSVPEKYLKRDPKPDQPLQTQPKTAYESDTSGCHTVSTAVSTNRKSFLQRLRIRGDWSDTGPTARPIGVTTSIGNESSVSMGNDATGTEGAQQQPDGESSHDSRQVNQAQTDEASQIQSQVVRRGRQATLARFSSLLNQILVQQFNHRAPSSTDQNDQNIQIESEATDRIGSPIHTTEVAVSTSSNANRSTEDESHRASQPGEQVSDVGEHLGQSSTTVEGNEDHQTAAPESTESKEQTETCIEVNEGMTDQNEVLSYEEQHSAYVKEVYEEVANAPIVETTEEQDKDEGSSDPETRSVSNTLVFVRETPGRISTSENPTSDVTVYMSPSPASQKPNENPTSTSSHVESSPLMLVEQNPDDSDTTQMETETASSGAQTAAGDSNVLTQNFVSGVQQRLQGTGFLQGSQGTTTTRSAEARWASVADDLMGMIRSRNRASNSRSAASRRNRFLLHVPSSGRTRHEESDQEAEELLRGHQQQTSDDEDDREESEGEEQEKKDAEILGLLGLKNAAVRMKFSGHRNTRTMIKQANFWGEDYVITGSDCGHIFFYERDSGKLVTILEADSHVVNCVQPHPSKCILASSGIDYNVKLWMPTGPPGLGPPPHMLELVERNVVMQRQTRDLITVPASFMLRLLAMATPAIRATDRERTTNTHRSNSNEAEDVTTEQTGGDDVEWNLETRDSDNEEESGDDNSSDVNVHSDDNL